MKRAQVIGMTGWLLGGALLGVARLHAFYLNWSASEPEGIWIVDPSARLRDNDDVVVCLPFRSVTRLGVRRHYLHRGDCASGLQPLLKQIVALAGDHISIGESGITVDGHQLPDSQPLAYDQAGRPMPHYPFGSYTVASGEAWLVSTHSPWSFDSRYFGPVPLADILRIVTPIWIHS